MLRFSGRTRRERHKSRIEAFYLPPYAPESNPDEYLNHGLKLRVHSGELPFTAESSGAVLQTFQAAGQSAGSAGASAAANAAAPGVGTAIQATEKAVSRIKETVENIAASASHSSSSWGALAALFLMPLLIIAAIAGALRGGGSAETPVSASRTSRSWPGRSIEVDL